MNLHTFRIFYDDKIQPLVNSLQKAVHLRVDWILFEETKRIEWASDEYAIRLVAFPSSDQLYGNIIQFQFVENPALSFKDSPLQLYDTSNDPVKEKLNMHLLVGRIQQIILPLQEKAMISEKKLLNEMIEQEVEQRLESLANEHLFYRKQQEARSNILSSISHHLTEAYRSLEKDTSLVDLSESKQLHTTLMQAINNWNSAIGSNHHLMEPSLQSLSVKSLIELWLDFNKAHSSSNSVKIEFSTPLDEEIQIDQNYFIHALNELINLSQEELEGPTLLSFSTQKNGGLVDLIVDGLDPTLDEHTSFGVLQRLFTHAGCDNITIDHDYRLVISFELVKKQDSFEYSEKINIKRNTKGLKALVADDNDINLLVNSTLLNELGFEVSEALNGEIAKELIEEDNYDLYLLDIRMPYADGLDVAKFIQSKPHQHKPIILLCTAYPNEVNPTSLEDSNIQEVIEKPLNEKRLLKSLSKVFL